jgi:cytochrome c-type biogenesis protein CcmE
MWALIAAGLLILAVLVWWPRTYTPAEITAKTSLVGQPVDVFGKLVQGSLQTTESNSVRFELEGGGGTLQAHFQGGASKDLDDAELLNVHGVVTAHGTLEVVRIEQADGETP